MSMMMGRIMARMCCNRFCPLFIDTMLNKNWPFFKVKISDRISLYVNSPLTGGAVWRNVSTLCSLSGHVFT